MTAGATVGSWTVLTGRSTARFSVRNFGVNRVTGTIPITGGSVRRDGDDITVRAELDLGALDTGNAKRDEDLRKPNLLDSAARPVLRFAAERMRADSDCWLIDGTLELRGVSCPVALRAEQDGESHVVATATLDRAPLGMRVPRFMIGRYVEITVDVRFAPA
ncbi:YceI family protein [Amycolatopsis sp. GM8]|uniref:YceI family protein n=1 Tax=Amycolatopsis sp. GM8 TaxID=2896530 RepID=UPI001F23B0D2|nr:YceI family protein [Amycolatopsis sp. GM8]